MDPVTMIVTAVAAGASAALKPAVEQTIKDAYAGLKNLISQKYPKASVAALEEKPQSKARQATLLEDLSQASAEGDTEVLQSAQALIRLIETKVASKQLDVGVNLEELIAGRNIVIRSDGPVSGKRWESGQDIRIDKLSGAPRGPQSPNT